MAFEANIIIGAAPMLVQFSDTTDGNIVSWYWTFGDGETSTEQSPTHIYTEGGRYDVSLEVTYADTTTDTFTVTDYIMVDAVRLEAATKCLRFATEQSEGYGWSELGGDDIAVPMDNYGAFTIEDDNGQNRDIIIDVNDFSLFEIDTCDRYIYQKPSALDKETTEIEWRKREKEHCLAEEADSKRIKHEVSNISIRPSDTDNRGASGYTASGLRIAQEITIEAYTGGEKITPTAISGKVVEGGETSFTGINVNDARVQFEIKGTAGEVQIASHVHKFLTEIGSPEPAKNLPGDYEIMMELATGKKIWLTRGYTLTRNRCTGTLLDGGIVAPITGPDGNESGFQCTENIICDNVAVAVESTVILWSKDANLITGISSWSTYGSAVNGWMMYYKRLITGFAANLEILAGSKFDIRVYNKRVSGEAIAALYTNTVNFGGSKFFPIG